MKGSKAVPGKGIGIVQPSDDGGDHTISAIIQVASGYEKYMKIEQEARNDNTSWATKITPAYPKASKGIAIDDASSAGTGFNISSIIESKGNAAKYIKISQNSSNDSTKTTTELTPSKIVPSISVGVTQPSSEGGNITIGAKMESEGCGAKYLKITQDSSDKDAGVTGTRLAPARITTGLGAAITQPSGPGENITISSITQNVTSDSDAKKYIKITQEAHDSGCGCGQADCGDGKDATNVTTKIENSKIVSSDARITVDQPTVDAGNIRIGMNLEINSGKGIQVTKTNNGTSIMIDALVGVSKGIGTTCAGSGQPHMFSAVVGTAGSGSKYLKVDQTTGSASLTETHTTLSPSRSLVGKSDYSDDYTEISGYDRSDWLMIDQPDSAGDDVIFIPTIIVPGVGITGKFNKKTRTYTLSNALLGGSWKTLSPETDYEFEFLGNFYSAGRAAYEPTGSDLTGKAYKVGKGSANKPTSDQYLQMQWQPSKDSNGVVTSASFRIRTTSDHTLFYAGDFMDDTDFKFKHSQELGSKNDLWCIARFKFRSGGTKWDNMNYINDEDKFDFIDTSGTTSGIWNVHDQEGKNKGLCWNVNCGIARLGTWFILYASQIADGYNSQYKTLCNAHEVTAAYTNYHLNLLNTFSVINTEI